MLPHRDDLMELASARLLGEGDVSRARESETASNFYAPQHVIAARRQQLLRGLQVAVKAAIELGMETPSGMRCDESAVYELCLALESCLEHHILPPIALFSQQSGLWLVLQQMHRQVSAARNTEGTSQRDPGLPLPLSSMAGRVLFLMCGRSATHGSAFACLTAATGRPLAHACDRASRRGVHDASWVYHASLRPLPPPCCVGSTS